MAVGLTARLGARELGARELAREEGRVEVGEVLMVRPSVGGLSGSTPSACASASVACPAVSDLVDLREVSRAGRAAAVRWGTPKTCASDDSPQRGQHRVIEGGRKGRRTAVLGVA